MFISRLNRAILIASCELVLKIITLSMTYLGFREHDIYYYVSL